MINFIKNQYAEHKENYDKVIKVAVPTIIALVFGILLLVLGPVRENQKLNQTLTDLSQPAQLPDPITPDDQTVATLKRAFAPSNITSQLQAITRASGTRLVSYKPGQKSSTVFVTGNLQQLANFNAALGRYYQILNTGQSRGPGPAIRILRYQMTAIVTRPGIYQVELSFDPVEAQ